MSKQPGEYKIDDMIREVYQFFDSCYKWNKGSNWTIFQYFSKEGWNTVSRVVKLDFAKYPFSKKDFRPSFFKHGNINLFQYATQNPWYNKSTQIDNRYGNFDKGCPKWNSSNWKWKGGTNV